MPPLRLYMIDCPHINTLNGLKYAAPMVLYRPYLLTVSDVFFKYHILKMAFGGGGDMSNMGW